jgi:plasmid stabilization system protein ParE
MSGYKFFSAADKSQDEIWACTLENFGQKQAEKYIINLHKHLQETSQDKANWKKLPANLANPLRPDIQLYVTKYEKHYVFFRELSGGAMGIISILHEAMEIPVRLKQDLSEITS